MYSDHNGESQRIIQECHNKTTSFIPHTVYSVLQPGFHSRTFSHHREIAPRIRDGMGNVRLPYLLRSHAISFRSGNMVSLRSETACRRGKYGRRTLAVPSRICGAVPSRICGAISLCTCLIQPPHPHFYFEFSANKV